MFSSISHFFLLALSLCNMTLISLVSPKPSPMSSVSFPQSHNQFFLSAFNLILLLLWPFPSPFTTSQSCLVSTNLFCYMFVLLHQNLIFAESSPVRTEMFCLSYFCIISSRDFHTFTVSIATLFSFSLFQNQGQTKGIRTCSDYAKQDLG